MSVENQQFRLLEGKFNKHENILTGMGKDLKYIIKSVDDAKEDRNEIKQDGKDTTNELRGINGGQRDNKYKIKSLKLRVKKLEKNQENLPLMRSWRRDLVAGGTGGGVFIGLIELFKQAKSLI
jgi:uncharacterized coiled-coil DUF342 family protein